MIVISHRAGLSVLFNDGPFPGEIQVTLSPSRLWPPNHRMVDVEAFVTGNDVVLQSVTSNEPDDADGNGDGRTRNDIQGVGAGAADFQFQLRAERAGTGEGRTYTVTYVATDDSGNMTTATSDIFVPHDQGGVSEPLLVSMTETGTGTVLDWDNVPGALSYDIIRGDVGNIQETNEFFHLGLVTCIAADAPETTTTGYEDPDEPSVGKAFFYLVEYNDGRPSGYGTESAAKERFVPPGQGCP